MANDSESLSASYGIGALVGQVDLIACKLGVATALVGAIWAGYTAIAAANRLRDDPWLYLVGAVSSWPSLSFADGGTVPDLAVERSTDLAFFSVVSSVEKSN